MPRLDATVSAMTVPTKACVTATFSDAKKYGMVRGNPTLVRISSLVALSARMTSSSSGSVVASPVATFTTMGKMHRIIAVSTAGMVPAPNQSTKIGTTATFGMLEKPIEQRIGHVIGELRRADERAEKDADEDAEREADQRGVEGLQRMRPDRRHALHQRGDDLARPRQHDVLDAERDARQLPHHEEADDEGGRRQAPAELRVHCTVSLPGRDVMISSRRRWVSVTKSGS